MKETILVLALFAFAFSLKAQNNTLLYEITGNGLEEPSYLYGTFHLICGTDFKIDEKVEKAVKNSEQIYLELDMDDPETMKQMQAQVMMKDNTLRGLIEDEKEAKVDAFLKEKTGYTLDMLNPMKPFVVGSMLYPKMMGCDAPAMFEMEFVKLASQNKQQIFGLETVEEQFGVFEKLGNEIQLEMLMEIVEDYDKSVKETQELLATYQQQDVEALYKLMTKEEEKYEGFLDELLVKRNHNWVAKIPQITKDKSTFIAVGAGHLGGEEGVIALLKKEGFEVTPVY